MCAAAIAAMAALIAYHFGRRRVAGSADALLQRADEMSWNDQWIAAEPIYKQAEGMFVEDHALERRPTRHSSHPSSQQVNDTQHPPEPLLRI
jgi:hypothetical protein